MKLQTPLTSTHKSIHQNVPYRISSQKYSEYYLHGRWFYSNITNVEMLTTKRHLFVTLLPTGWKRLVVNVFQWAIGSSYRVKKLTKLNG